MIHLSVRIKVCPSLVTEWWCVVTKHAAASRQEIGCLRFDVLSGDDGFELQETWASKAALAAHRQTPHYLSWQSKIAALQSKPRERVEYSWALPHFGRANKVVSRCHLLEAVKANQNLVLTNGCFDVLHPGHVRLLRQARSEGSLLIVALDSDANVRKLKGPSRPINTWLDRAAVLEALASVDYIVPLCNHEDLMTLINDMRPDVLVKGGDYTHATVVGHELVESYGGRITIVPHTGHSTTAILQAAQGGC